MNTLPALLLNSVSLDFESRLILIAIPSSITVIGFAINLIIQKNNFRRSKDLMHAKWKIQSTEDENKRAQSLINSLAEKFHSIRHYRIGAKGNTSDLKVLYDECHGLINQLHVLFRRYEQANKLKSLAEETLKSIAQSNSTEYHAALYKIRSMAIGLQEQSKALIHDH